MKRFLAGLLFALLPVTPTLLAAPYDEMDYGPFISSTYQLPNGQYVIKLTVLKALGDDTNPAHVEAWTSPVITIARP